MIKLRAPLGRARAESEGAEVINRKCFYGLVLIFAGLAISPSRADVAHCRFISSAKDRLACFDKETELVHAPASPTAADPDQEKPDSPSEILRRENDLLNKRMGTIFQGC
jgi:hypothetical protein